MSSLDTETVFDEPGGARKVELAAKYVAGTLTEDEAFDIIHQLRWVTQSWPISSISAEDIANAFYEGKGYDAYADENLPKYDELYDLAGEAAHHVYRKWDGDEYSTARDWGVELVEGYAIEAGLEIPDKEDEQ